MCVRENTDHVRRWRGAISSAISLNSPTSLSSKCGEYVIHVRPCRQREIPVLPESGEHPAGDGSAVALSQLSSLFLLLSLLPPLAASGSGGGRGGGEATGPAGVGVGVGVRVGVGAVVALRVEILL